MTTRRIIEPIRNYRDSKENYYPEPTLVRNRCDKSIAYTVTDMWFSYPYKLKDYSVQEGRNFISKADEVVHAHSLKLREYKEIYFAFVKIILEVLLDGFGFELPYHLGVLKVIKYDNKKFYKARPMIDFNKTRIQKAQYIKEGKSLEDKSWVAYHKNIESGGFLVLPRLLFYKRGGMKYLGNWSKTFAVKFKRTLYKNLKADLTYHFRFDVYKKKLTYDDLIARLTKENNV